MSEKRKTGGGTFDPNAERIFFIAGNTSTLHQAYDVNDHILIAVNELATEEDITFVESLCDMDKKLFIDSGVFNLSMTHARKHNLSMDVALSTPPEDVDGFGNLFEKYTALIKKLENKIWGYIEIDQGGRENKIKTRTRLESMGFSPIPVYHPLLDGWDYFDYLAERYDRICFGNIVQAPPDMRQRLLATMWERHRKYPNLWIHILGLTPNHFMNAYPSNSADSSRWLGVVRWANLSERAGCATVSQMPLDFFYNHSVDQKAPNGWNKGVKTGALWSRILERNWRNQLADLERLGVEIYPHD